MALLIIPNEVTSQTYTVGASQSVFPFTFAVFAKSDLHFSVGSVELMQSDFTLSGTVLEGGGYQGGTVTLNVAVVGVTCTLWRETDPSRTTSFYPAPSVPVRDLDVALNHIAAIAQDIKRDLANSGVGTSAVFSVAGRTGAVTLAAADVATGFGAQVAANLVAGLNITLTTVSGITTIAASVTSGVSSVAGRTGAVSLTAADVSTGFGAAVGATLVGGTNVTVSTVSGVTTISATAGGGGVSSLNTRTGAVTLDATDVGGSTASFGGSVNSRLAAGANITLALASNITTIAVTGVAQTANNLSDLANFTTARSNLGLGALAVLGTITASLISDPTNVKTTESFLVAISDEVTALTTGTAKVTFRIPYAFTVTAIRASLNTVSSSGLPTFDVKKNGTTVFSTLLSINASAKTSVGATTPAVISVPSWADDDEITVDITIAGTGAKGAKLALIGHRT